MNILVVLSVILENAQGQGFANILGDAVVAAPGPVLVQTLLQGCLACVCKIHNRKGLY